LNSISASISIEIGPSGSSTELYFGTYTLDSPLERLTLILPPEIV